METRNFGGIHQKQTSAPYTCQDYCFGQVFSKCRTLTSEVALVYFKRNEFNGWKTEKYDNSIMTHRYSVRRWSSPICGHGRQPHRDRAAPTMLSCAAVFAAPSGNLRFFFRRKTIGHRYSQLVSQQQTANSVWRLPALKSNGSAPQTLTKDGNPNIRMINEMLLQVQLPLVYGCTQPQGQEQARTLCLQRLSSFQLSPRENSSSGVFRVQYAVQYTHIERTHAHIEDKFHHAPLYVQYMFIAENECLLMDEIKRGNAHQLRCLRSAVAVNQYRCCSWSKTIIERCRNLFF